MEGLIPLLMHTMKKHRLQNSFRSLSAGSYHLLEGTVADQGSSHRRTRSHFEPPSAEYLQQRSSFGFVSQPMDLKKDSKGSTASHGSKIKTHINLAQFQFTSSPYPIPSHPIPSFTVQQWNPSPSLLAQLNTSRRFLIPSSVSRFYFPSITPSIDA
ncbi:hypothetical protein L1987_31913 [Smallanthus sonchifolius]|uniref:Uncharacterized protein n=1 Tax=Smallanthus sonchifolius TaxID=185202 RepID=A0ACB9I7M1_9ASTR|nr:hypothetical protein L1987_31913 [Smallanthus sonchifolius]